jgi:hypothetical protein
MAEHPRETPAHPLSWPLGWNRTEPWERKRARYSVSFATARDDLLSELSLLRAKGVVLSTNIPVKRDGLPYAVFKEPADPGVAIYFEVGSASQVIACDKWDLIKDNVRACGYAVASLRQLERCGATEILERAFTGFQALPSGDDPWSVLGIEPTTSEILVRKAYKARALQCHPDVPGGTTEAFQRLQWALSEALERGDAHARHGASLSTPITRPP